MSARDRAHGDCRQDQGDERVTYDFHVDALRTFKFGVRGMDKRRGLKEVDVPRAGGGVFQNPVGASSAVDAGLLAAIAQSQGLT